MTREREKKVLYVQLDKALYGCVQSALLWYELYTKTLQEMGFILNPHDLCVANSEIEGSQCTICWYVDYNKISHKSKKVIENVISKIEQKFGKMTKTYGDDQEFLGMDITFEKGKVRVGMKRHILKAFEALGEEITRNAATPANSFLFEVRDSPELDEKEQMLFTAWCLLYCIHPDDVGWTSKLQSDF